MEKKKLLLVAISTGLFLVLTIGAAIVVFAPGNAAASSVAQARQSGIQTGVNPAPVINSTVTGSPDPIDLVRANDNIPSPQPFLSGINGRETESGANGSAQGQSGVIPETATVAAPRTIPEAAPSTVTAVIPPPETLISVQRPSAAAVPNTAPAGRAATTVTSPAPSASAPPATTRAPATVSAPAATGVPAAASAPATTSAPAATSAPATASNPTVTGTPATALAPATASNPATVSAPASTPVTTNEPSATATAAVTETGAAAGTTTTGNVLIPAVAQAVPVQTRIQNDFWIQTGAFSTVTRAEAVKDSLASKGIVSLIENHIIDGRPIFRVRVGPYTSLNEANYWLYLIQSIDGFEDSQIRQTPRQG